MDETGLLDLTDLQLVTLVHERGSEQACRALHRRHTPGLLMTAWRIVGQSQDDAEDAVQEAWVRGLTSLETWRAESSFAAWMRGIVVHTSLDMMRRAKKLEHLEDDIDSNVHSVGDRMDIESAIAALPAGYRAVLVLFDVEGYSHEEIGARLGISAGTSRGQLFKARRALRNLLGPIDGEENV
jgi:RNA polymerase sigma factor (sigma-70 family)